MAPSTPLRYDGSCHFGHEAESFYIVKSVSSKSFHRHQDTFQYLEYKSHLGDPLEEKNQKVGHCHVGDNQVYGLQGTASAGCRSVSVSHSVVQEAKENAEKGSDAAKQEEEGGSLDAVRKLITEQAQALGQWALAAAPPMLQSTGSVVVVLGLSSGAMWDLPGPGIEPVSPALAGYQASKPAALSRLERGELWPMEDEVHSRICPGYRVSKSDVLSKLKQGKERWMTEDEIHSRTWPGYQGTKPDLLSKLEHGKEPCIIENEMQNRICPGIGKGDSYLPEHSRNQRFLKSMQQCSEQNAFRKSVHLSKTHFTLVQDCIFNLHRKALESSLSLVNQKSSYGIKNPVEFNGDEKSFLHSDYGQLYSGIIFPESFQASTPEVLSKLEQGEPRMMDDEIHCQTRSEVWKFDDHLLEYLQNESMEKRLEPWHEQNQLENAFHQSITHFLLRQHHDVFGLHGKCMKSNLTLLSQNLSYEIKSSSFQASISEVLSKLDQGEPWMMDDEIHCQTRSAKSPQSSVVLQEKNLNTVKMHLPPLAPQSPVGISGLLANRSMVLVGQPVTRWPPTGDNRGLAQERTLMNSVNVVVPSVVNCILFYVTGN
ncbi:hypothetical protein JEQ12_005637 [Ovis aries]|uniref:Uncharacterized protein n=1 Tax=Ovis aries TaxID=9940 RepID=A0A836CZL3_SHEEP|nr:hypothetical protein JEQ12_005637 [Ovis aries]